MALTGRDEADGAMAVFLVVPTHECGGPAARLKQVLERLDGQLRSIFQGTEQGFRIGVVIAHRGAAPAGRHTQALHGRQNGFALHRRAVVRVHHELPGSDALSGTDVLQQPGGQLRALAVKHLPAHDLAAEEIDEQVQIAAPAL